MKLCKQQICTRALVGAKKADAMAQCSANALSQSPRGEPVDLPVAINFR